MALIARNIVKSFGKVTILHGIDVDIADGEFLSISGRSGSGKSTLLYILSTLDLPTTGDLSLDGHDIAKLSVKELHQFRGKNIGFIFQFHYLLPELSALENVLLPARNFNLHKKMKPRAMELLEELEIASHCHKLPDQLSGGQQQRVAIARGLLLRPRYIFADEPTGNLDSQTGMKVMEILKRVNRDDGTTIVLVTHEPDYARMAKREIFLVDGRVEKEVSFDRNGPSPSTN